MRTGYLNAALLTISVITSMIVLPVSTVGVVSASPDVIQIKPPVDDTYVRDKGAADWQFGDRTYMYVGYYSSYDQWERAYVKFDLGSIYGEIADARLCLYAWKVYGNPIVGVAGAGDGWDEGAYTPTPNGLTWNTQEELAGISENVGIYDQLDILDEVAIDNEYQYYSWDVTDFVKAESAGDKVASFLLILKDEGTSAGEDDTVALDPKEWYDNDKWPYLEVTYSPSIPPSVEGLKARPDPFSPDNDGIEDVTKIKYILIDDRSPTLHVEVNVLDADGNLVCGLFSGDLEASPTGVKHKQIWDGEDNLGKTVSDGRYLIYVSATDEDGNRVVAQEDVVVNAASFEIENASFDPNKFNPWHGETTTLSYMLSEPAKWLSVRIKNQAGEVVRQLVTKEPRPAGLNAEVWDGKDDNGDIPPQGTYKAVIKARSYAREKAKANASVEVSHAEWIVITPPAGDTMVVDKGAGDWQYGEKTYMYVGYYSAYDEWERAYVKFDLSSIGGRPIVDARVYLFVWKVSGDTTIACAEVPSDNWDEGSSTSPTPNGLTWNTQEELAGISENVGIFGELNILDEVAISATYEWYSWDITSFVQRESSGDGIASLLFIDKDEGTEAGKAHTTGLSSKEYSDGRYAARLEVTLAAD